jgi:hypothetical protein
MREETFFYEDEQGFPDRPATDLELRGEGNFAKILPRLEMTLSEGRSNGVRHHVAN